MAPPTDIDFIVEENLQPREDSKIPYEWGSKTISAAVGDETDMGFPPPPPPPSLLYG